MKLALFAYLLEIPVCFNGTSASFLFYQGSGACFMVKKSVIYACLFFGLSGIAGANAAQNVRAGDGGLTLPVYNPLRYRVPATHEAQKLHRQILRVRRDLKVLRAVPLNDPSIESRLKKIIQQKITQIESRLEVLKKDMKRRQALTKTPHRSERIIPAKDKSAKDEGRTQTPTPKIKKKLQGKDQAEEIRDLKKTLLEVSKKLAALEQGMKPTISSREEEPQTINISESPQGTGRTPSQQGQVWGRTEITLPVAREYIPSAPKQVRTSVIYPGASRPETPQSVTYYPSLPQWKPQARLSEGVYLPLPKPAPFLGQHTRAATQNGKHRLRDKKAEKKYASVGDEADTVNQWPEAAVAKAKIQCAKLFEKLNISFSAKSPIKKGHCGTPAPILFKGFGKTNLVKISPAATINCKTAAVIARWMNDKVQPLALRLLGAPIAKIHNVASYNCRNRYGRKNGRISEHAFANALDVMGFTTQKGENISVLIDFYAENNKGEFLRKIHQLACKDKFGTVLGPEANAAHKNHFHLDLAKRRRSAYCE